MGGTGILVKYVGESVPTMISIKDTHVIYKAEKKLDDDRKFLPIDYEGKTTYVRLDRVEYIKFIYDV